jgi:hypothetical protein
VLTEIQYLRTFLHSHRVGSARRRIRTFTN